MVKNSEKNVLVTGITGFIGSHVAIQLLNKEYSVRGTLRDPGRKDSILRVLKENCPNTDLADFVKGELTNPEDWNSAMEGMDYVMHVASPLPFDLKKDENDLIIPAREGTLNVLKAANKHNIKRVILTSSIAAIGHGHEGRNGTYTEDDWTNLKSKKETSPYIKSKTIAESAAWKFVSNPEINMEMAVINPGYVLGPLLEKDYSDSAVIVKKVLKGDMPGLPGISFPLVDVRDVAEMHLWAMEKPEAAGLRFICVNETSWYKEIARILKENYPEYKKKIKTYVLPDVMIRLYSFFDKDARTIRNELGRKNIFDNSRAVNMFNWKPRSNKEAILSMADSLIKFGIV
jgi:dihydroflavonol-4-reductase